MAQTELQMPNDTDGTNFIDRGLNVAKKYMQIKNHFVRELIAEFIGTAFLMLMGESAGAVQTLSKNQSGNVITSNLAWGLGVCIAIIMTGNISGGHFNPAISITSAFLGKLAWKKVIPYCLAQVFGAFFGAAIVLAVYYDAINAFDGGVRQIDGPNGTAGIFATYPSAYLSTGGAFFDAIVGTSCLVIAVLAVIDPNNGFPQHLVPFAVAFFVVCNGFTFAYNAGSAINPARDLGPRILTALAGWGPGVFSYRNYSWFWIPVIGPILGGLVGAIIYSSAIGIHYPKKEPVAELTPIPASALPRRFTNETFLNSIYLSQQSIDFLESLGKRDSTLPLVRSNS